MINSKGQAGAVAQHGNALARRCFWPIANDGEVGACVIEGQVRERAAAMPSARELRDLNGSATLESVFLQLIQATEGEW